ncbi:MAG: hypothetical protein IPL46_35635 [Saprospiraceae bacterium]|nr:hypothetical protein [Saprospiraceae bacterium]
MIKRITWLHILLFFAAVKLILHFSTNTLWSLHRDALLYLALGRHLDWGYASVPPSIAFSVGFRVRYLGAQSLRFGFSYFDLNPNGHPPQD